MAAHSRFGASGAYRWMACPASIRRSAGIPNVSSEWALEGTKLHEAAEAVLRRSKREARLLADLTDEQRDVVSLYVNTVRDLESREDWLFSDYEKRVKALHLHPEFYGTADTYAEFENGAVIVDLKAGAGVSVSTDYDGKLNPQLGYYLIAALAVRGVLIFPDRIEGSGIAPARLEIVIVQPRAGGVKRRPVLLLELMDLAGDLVEAAAKAELADPPAAAGSHCKFCLARGACPTLRRKVIDMAKDEFGAFPDPMDMTAEEVGEALANAALMETWIEAVRDHAKNLMTKGTVIPGWRAQERFGNRQWKDMTMAAEWAEATATALALPVEEMFEPATLKSPAQVEKILKRAKVETDTLQDYVTRKPSGLALVADASRQSAAADFEE